jgi:hypothetical protein
MTGGYDNMQLGQGCRTPLEAVVSAWSNTGMMRELGEKFCTSTTLSTEPELPGTEASI